MPMMCGGTGAQREADAEIQTLVESHRPAVEKKTGKTFEIFEAKSYTTQVVAGTNYFIKVHVGGEEYVHVRIFKPLPHTGEQPSLHSIQKDKSHDDPVVYF